MKVISSEDIVPALKIVGNLTLNALDSLPLPLLVVVFLICLALLYFPPSTPLLPLHSPVFHEKSRLSPHPHTPPRLPSSPVFYPALDPSGRPHFIAVDPSDMGMASGTQSPPRLSCSPGVGRRWSRHKDLWKGGMLGVVEEEKTEV